MMRVHRSGPIAGLMLGAGLLVFVLGATTQATEVPQRDARLALRVIDAGGRPMTARVRVLPVSLAERARLMMWRDREAVARHGRIELSLAPGRYLVRASRGPEWSLAEAEVELVPGERDRRTLGLVHQVWLDGWRAADLHVHTTHSGDARAHGGVSSEALEAEGIEVAAITDHNAVGAMDAGAVATVAGVEITTWNPEVGHFNAFPLRAVPQWQATSPRELFAALGAPGVFVQVNHPRLEEHIAYFELGRFDGDQFLEPGFDLDADGLEVWNGYDIERLDRVERLLQDWRHWIAKGHRLTATGGSDSHGKVGHHAGYPRTYVRAPDASSMAPALEAGHAFVTNGPLLSFDVDGRGPGDELLPGRAPSVVRVRVLAPDWIRVAQVELWLDERCVWSQALAAPTGQVLRFEAQAVLRLGGARTLHALVRGGDGLDRLLGRRGSEPLAFTNALYLLGKPNAPTLGRRRAPAPQAAAGD